MKSSATEAVRLFQGGRIAEAEVAARGLLAANARDAEALHLLGCIRAQAGAQPEALALMDQALAIDPGNPAFVVNRGRVLAQLGLAWLRAGDDAQAARAFEAALPAFPRDASLRNNLGLALQRLGRADEAIAHFIEAAQFDPALDGVLVNWGNALETRGDLEGARAKFREAISRKPRSAAAWLNAASIEVDLGHNAAAREAYARVLEINPGSPDARYGLALIDLREQRFGAGWDGHEARFDTDPPQSARRGPPLPALIPEDLGRHRRVAVWSEQGIGDQVLYSTLLPALRDAGMDVVAEVDPRMLAAYRRSVPGIEFVSADNATFEGCERQVAIGSLARFFRRDAASFASQPAALLAADPARVAAIRAQLPAGRCVAISWRSVQRGARASRGVRKSAPLASFATLARDRDVRLADVQYGDVEIERAEFERQRPGLLVRVPGLDAFSDLEGVMAAIVACASVVTTSNVVAHLAGALGVPATVVFLGGLAPFHYWNAVQGRRSLWYPSLEVAGDAAWRDWSEAFDVLSARFDR